MLNARVLIFWAARAVIVFSTLKEGLSLARIITVSRLVLNGGVIQSGGLVVSLLYSETNSLGITIPSGQTTLPHLSLIVDIKSHTSLAWLVGGESSVITTWSKKCFERPTTALAQTPRSQRAIFTAVLFWGALVIMLKDASSSQV